MNPRGFTAICVRCGWQMNATNAVDDGWQLLITTPNTYRGIHVNAVCWRCDRDARAAAMQPLGAFANGD